MSGTPAPAPRPKVATVKAYRVEIEAEGQPYHWTGKAQHAARAALLALLAMKRQHPECQRKATMVSVYEL